MLNSQDAVEAIADEINLRINDACTFHKIKTLDLKWLSLGMGH